MRSVAGDPFGGNKALRFIPAKGLPTDTALVRRNNRLGHFLADRATFVGSGLSYYSYQIIQVRIAASPATSSPIKGNT